LSDGHWHWRPDSGMISSAGAAGHIP